MLLTNNITRRETQQLTGVAQSNGPRDNSASYRVARQRWGDSCTYGKEQKSRNSALRVICNFVRFGLKRLFGRLNIQYWTADGVFRVSDHRHRVSSGYSQKHYWELVQIKKRKLDPKPANQAL